MQWQIDNIIRLIMTTSSWCKPICYVYEFSYQPCLMIMDSERNIKCSDTKVEYGTHVFDGALNCVT